MIDRVRIFDTTLRDGEQAARINLNKGEKLQIARQLGGHGGLARALEAAQQVDAGEA